MLLKVEHCLYFHNVMLIKKDEIVKILLARIHPASNCLFSGSYTFYM